MKKWNVCPYELSLDLAVWTDAVICDYNYVFDPRAHLRRFFGESKKGEYLFLIDEAHNLAERGREMYSALICKEDILKIRSKVKETGSKKLLRALEKCNRQLLEMKRECSDSFRVLPGPGALPYPWRDCRRSWRIIWKKYRKENCEKRCWNFISR